jgi:hypothetical protein
MEIISFFLSFLLFYLRHHTFKKSAENKNDVDLDEVGPRFEMKRKYCLKI